MLVLIRSLAIVLIVCIVIAILGAWSYRFGWSSSFNSALQITIVPFFIIIAIAFLSISILFIQIIRRKTDNLLLIFSTGLVSLFIAGYGAINYNKTATLPPIHNISTDLVEPPGFTETTLELRGVNANSVELNEQTKEMTQNAYSEVQPLTTDVSVSESFDLALAVAEQQGWDVHYQSMENNVGVIEATDTSFWFGFVDDVSVRIKVDQEDSTRIDLQSVSRVGLSDLGVNADRIGDFLEDMDEKLQELPKN